MSFATLYKLPVMACRKQPVEYAILLLITN